MAHFCFVNNFIVLFKLRQNQWLRLRPWTWWIVDSKEECRILLASCQLLCRTQHSSLGSTGHHFRGLSLSYLSVQCVLNISPVLSFFHRFHAPPQSSDISHTHIHVNIPTPHPSTPKADSCRGGSWGTQQVRTLCVTDVPRWWRGMLCIEVACHYHCGSFFTHTQTHTHTHTHTHPPLVNALWEWKYAGNHFVHLSRFFGCGCW